MNEHDVLEGIDIGESEFISINIYDDYAIVSDEDTGEVLYCELVH